MSRRSSDLEELLRPVRVTIIARSHEDNASSASGGGCAAGRAFLRRALGGWSDEDAARLAGQLARLDLDLGAAPDLD